MLKLLFCTLVTCVGLNYSQYYLDENNISSRLYRKLRHSEDTTQSRYNKTVFTALGNYEVNATLVAERNFKWIGRVVHSQRANYPQVCTAICIDEGIFITAAACISTLKVIYTTVIYNFSKLRSRAFVVPAYGTKQAYDDIGFIIVDKEHLTNWPTIELFDTTNRTDDGFRWFSDLFSDDEVNHKVVGYAVPKFLSNIITYDNLYYLSELPVVVNINLCPSILTFNNLISGFFTPCYHSCSIRDYKAQKEACARYHGVEGGAVYNIKTNKLLGVATWGPRNKHPLPVGFAVPNSENFFKNYDCAKRIRNYAGESYLGYQHLCND